MPLFDFRCTRCENEFELLVRGQVTPSCPSCGATDLARLPSMPSVKSDTTRALAMKAARARDSRQGAERVAAQREYEANHD